MTIIKAIFLGIIQGLTEFLPVSSSGHLSVISHFMHVDGGGSLLFEVLLHLGTLLAVFIMFRKTIWGLIQEFLLLIQDIVHKNFSFKKSSDRRKMLIFFVISCLPLLVLLIPVGGGQNIMDLVSVFSEDTSVVCEGVCFLVTGSLLLIACYRAGNIKYRVKMNPAIAVFVGIAQLFAAAFPGLSRSGSTISTGLFFGVPKKYMIRYSFILGIPAIIAANIMEIKDAISAESTLTAGPAIAGIAMAAIAGIVAIKLISYLLQNDKFKYFGFYCLGIGGITLVASVIEKAIG